MSDPREDPVTHGPHWPSDWVPGEPPSCRCGYNGTPDECASSGATPEHTTEDDA